jgi:hypothetical protein
MTTQSRTTSTFDAVVDLETAVENPAADAIESAARLVGSTTS